MPRGDPRHPLPVRVTADEDAAIAKGAKRARMSKTAFVRAAAIAISRLRAKDASDVLEAASGPAEVRKA